MKKKVNRQRTYTTLKKKLFINIHNVGKKNWNYSFNFIHPIWLYDLCVFNLLQYTHLQTINIKYITKTEEHKDVLTGHVCL